MNEMKKRLLTVGGAVMTALAIALSLLAFVAVNVSAATDTGSSAMSDIIPGEDGTSVLPLPEGGNVDSDDVLTPDDTPRTPAVTSTPDAGSTPSGTTAGTPGTTGGDGTDSGNAGEDDGGGIMGAIIAVIVVVAIILVVIALIPRKKK